MWEGGFTNSVVYAPTRVPANDGTPYLAGAINSTCASGWRPLLGQRRCSGMGADYGCILQDMLASNIVCSY